ncbi:YczO [Bacillus subtilis]|nr:YczO [Bacillus subtilis]
MTERKQKNKPNENPEHNDLTDPIPNEELKENMNDENTNGSKEITHKANGITIRNNETPHKSL